MSLADTLTKLSNARGAIVDALGSKGVSLPSSATLYSCASAIRDIPTGGADVTLGVVDSAGKFQAFSFNGTTPSDSGSPETVTNYKSWNSTLPAPAPGSPMMAGLIGRSITSLSIPAGVTIIGPFICYYCSSLTSVTIPVGVIEIQEYAFYNCTALTEVTLPAGLTLIGNSAFFNCSALTEVTLPAGLKHIMKNAFAECNALTEVTLPAGMISIGTHAFASNALTNIYCGFAEGAVSGAPWGATNATVHYAE